MAMVGSRKWVILEHSAAHGWNNQCAIGTVSDNAYSSRIMNTVESSSVGHLPLCLFYMMRWTLFSSCLFAPRRTAALHNTRSWATISQFATLIEKFHHGHCTLALEAKLGSSNVTCAFRQFPIQYLFGNSGVIHVCNVSKPHKTPRPANIECQFFLVVSLLPAFFLQLVQCKDHIDINTTLLVTTTII